MGSFWFRAIAEIATIHLVFFAVSTGILLVWRKAKNDSEASEQSARIEPINLAKAISLGFAFTLLLLFWFSYTQNQNPLYAWLVENMSQSNWYRPLVLAQTQIQKMLWGIPFAWWLLSISPKRPVIYLLAFMVPGLIGRYKHLVMQPELLAEWQAMLPGMIFSLTLFPIVYTCIYKLRNH